MPVTDVTPLPVRVVAASGGSGGHGGGVGQFFEPFASERGVPIRITLPCDWAGWVRLLRTHDAGAVPVLLTAGGLPWASYATNACETAAVESDSAARYHSSVELTGGTLTYRAVQ